MERELPTILFWFTNLSNDLWASGVSCAPDVEAAGPELIFAQPNLSRVFGTQYLQELSMKKLSLLLLLGFVFIGPASIFAADGLVALQSSYSAAETMDRFEAIAKKKGLNIFARINHAAGAAKIGKTLRPTEVLIFGNAQGGTPFMECSQTVGIDLPLKVLVWQDASGQVWLGYNDPVYLAKRHEVESCPVAAKLNKALAGLSAATLAH